MFYLQTGSGRKNFCAVLCRDRQTSRVYVVEKDLEPNRRQDVQV